MMGDKDEAREEYDQAPLSLAEKVKSSPVSVFVTRASTEEAPPPEDVVDREPSMDDVFMSAEEDDDDELASMIDRGINSDYDVATSADESVMTDRTEEIEPTPEERADIVTRLRKQVEFYFGDENFSRDRFLRTKARLDPAGWIDLSVISSFKKIRKISRDATLLREAIEQSDVVTLNDAVNKIKRIHPLPKDPVIALTHTVVIESIGNEPNEQEIKVLAEKSGHVNRVRFHNPSNEPLPDDIKKFLDEKAGSKRSHIHPGLRPTGAVLALVEMDDLDECYALIAQLNKNTSGDWRIGARASLLYQKEKRRRKKKDANQSDMSGLNLSRITGSPLSIHDASHLRDGYGSTGSSPANSPRSPRRQGRRQIMGPDGAGSPNMHRRSAMENRHTSDISWRRAEVPNWRLSQRAETSPASLSSSPIGIRTPPQQRARSQSPATRGSPRSHGLEGVVRSPLGPPGEGVKGFAGRGRGLGISSPSFHDGIEKIGFLAVSSPPKGSSSPASKAKSPLTSPDK
eukprot:m.21195 g.21195  ORF g.21195 m.21195 type:complete len:515 (-) comp7073_c0_seq1:154-1698(-)